MHRVFVCCLTCCKLRILWHFLMSIPSSPCENISPCLISSKVDPGCRDDSSSGRQLVSICSYFYHGEVFWRDIGLTVKSSYIVSAFLISSWCHHLHQTLPVRCVFCELSVIFPCSVSIVMTGFYLIFELELL